MSYIESALIPGEALTYQTRLHWMVMFGHLILGCLCFAGSAGLAYLYWLNRGNFGVNTLHLIEGTCAALFLVGVIAIMIGMVRRNATELAVTTRRVLIKQGLISRRTIEMLLSKIETIEVSESTAGRVFGYGTIVLIGTGGTSEPFKEIARPLVFRSAVLEQLEKLPAPGRAPTDAVPPATPAHRTSSEAGRAD